MSASRSSWAKKNRRIHRRIDWENRRWLLKKPFYGWWRPFEFRCDFCPLRRKECVQEGCRRKEEEE